MEKGKHLILDCWDCPEDKLASKAVVEDFLRQLPDSIGMRKISKPMVVEHKAEKEEDSGMTGCIFLAESHIAIHTFPKRGYVGIDLYSCKPFESSIVISEVKDQFIPDKMDVHELDRGVRI
jgi:S-adenosylmethionine decarboxylase